MRRSYLKFSILPLMLILSGCSSVGNKAASVSVVYGAATIFALLLLVGYCCAEKKKDVWYLLLFSSVLVVNIGYFMLGISRSLGEALLANRLAYLGSVLLPLSMYMIIMHVANITYPKWLSGVLLGISMVVFLIAASPGYLDIYYKEVTLMKVNGLSVLNKVYGPLHGLYMIYLFGYFTAMVATIVHATLKDKIESLAYAVILAIAVFVNICVWLVEQFVRIDFEILSISYIISESFLLGLHLLMAETEKNKACLLQQAIEEMAKPVVAPVGADEKDGSPVQQQVDPSQIDIFIAGLSELTPKESAIFQCYVNGMTTSQIMEQLCIKENTLKFHNKNLYGKLGVSSRKQLLAMYKQYSAEQSAE